MGRHYDGQEKGVLAIKGLHPAGKELLMHHFNNSLCGALGFLDQGDIAGARECLDHMVDDMKEFGLNEWEDMRGRPL